MPRKFYLFPIARTSIMRSSKTTGASGSAYNSVAIFHHSAMFETCPPTRPLNRVTVWDAERRIGKKTPIFGAAVGHSSAITVFKPIAVQVSRHLHEHPAPSARIPPPSSHPQSSFRAICLGLLREVRNVCECANRRLVGRFAFGAAVGVAEEREKLILIPFCWQTRFVFELRPSP